MIKVLVVDDSLFMRKMITNMLTKYSDIDVIATAKNGEEAVELNNRFSPDVITMDIEMPKKNGLEALKEIMATKPTRVIMLSSLTVEGARETIKSLEYGAFDFISKPDGKSISLNIDKVEHMLIAMIREAVKVNAVKLRPKLRIEERLEHHAKPSILAGDKKVKDLASGVSAPKVVLIGISTGGPKALQQIIPMIPKNIDAAILIVQHMPPKFTKSLAERLNELSALNVKEAEENDVIIKGQVYIAPGSHHMLIKKNASGKKVIKLSDSPPRQGHRPSVEVMYQSAMEFYKPREIVAVIMTGMGKDGSEAIKEIRNYGGITIGQSEETCIVYGMPRVAANLDGLDHVVDLGDIPDHITKMLK